ncbi:hypothetical protein EYF80_044652 [Liparis tanakae]|uniref:Uncharacterized protein n=1 Tax=Liparis tanakae TaxID=230148 RepID=A0A4Z2FVC6_9TELE|nr:hypothetical protein EYF80_044652 [Liparis tanakae]
MLLLTPVLRCVVALQWYDPSDDAATFSDCGVEDATVLDQLIGDRQRGLRCNTPESHPRAERLRPSVVAAIRRPSSNMKWNKTEELDPRNILCWATQHRSTVN